MSTVQNLKKQLRGIRSTQKLTKAMKTVSTVKFSKLNG
ncbi:MAG: F0F1 ATP synthase subunit gamma, partial [Clostridia bacterium]|nr:F0F1 ATP synthase subunit gamma [Clostridia bacterium]